MRDDIQHCQGTQSPRLVGTKFDAEEILSDRTVVFEESGTPENKSQH